MTVVDSRFRLRLGKGDNSSRYLTYYLGHWQLYDPVNSKILTFTQGLAGDFAQARPNISFVQGTGPGTDRQITNVGAKLLTDPAWADRDTFSTGAGQSTRGAATPTATLDDDTTAVTGQPYLTIEAPLPGKLVTFKNGPNSNPAGPSSPARDVVVRPSDYEGDLEDAKAGLNPTILRELPGLTAGIVWANALPDGGRHTLLDGFVGSSTIGDVTGRFATVVSATYNQAAKTATYITSTTNNVQVGEVFGSGLFELTGISPSGYATGGTTLSVDYVNGVRKSITVSMPINPGSPAATVTTGSFMDWGTAAKNQFTEAQYWKDNHVRPGKTAFYAFHEENGHESAANVGTVAAGITLIHDVLRRFVTHVKNIINPLQADPPIIHAQNNTPRFDFDENINRIGECSASCCLMQDYLVLNGLDTTYLTHPTFMMTSDQNGVQLSSPHFKMTSEPMMGSINGHSAVEYWNGTYTPPPILNNDWTMVFDQPTKILGTSNVALEIDTVEVPDPNGFGGMQVLHLNLGNIGLLNRFSLEATDFRTAATEEQTLSAVALSGTNITITGTFDIRRLFVTAGFKLARTLIKPSVNSNIVAAQWSGPGVGQTTIDFDADIGFGVGGYCRIYQANGQDSTVGWNNLTPGWPILAGSTSTHLVTTIPTQPDPWTSAGRTVAIAQYSVGRNFGNTHCFVKVENPAAPKRWNIMTGEWLRERMLTPKPRAVFGRSSKKFLVDQRTEIGGLYSNWLNIINGIYDFADDRTWASTGTVKEALGNTGENLSIRSNVVLTGTHNSGSNATYGEVTVAVGYLAAASGATRWATAHKRGAKWGWDIVGRHKTSANNQYWGSTHYGEGVLTSGQTDGGGVHLRVSPSGVPLATVRGLLLATVWSQTATGITLTDGQDFHWEGDIQDSVDGITPGWGWMKFNGTLVWEGNVIYGNDGTVSNTWSPPDTGAAASRFTFGINGLKADSTTGLSNATRRWTVGTRIYSAMFGEGGGKTDESDWRPSWNSVQWRMDGNAF